MISRILNRMISYEGGTIPNMEQEGGEDGSPERKTRVIKRTKVGRRRREFVRILYGISNLHVSHWLT